MKFNADLSWCGKICYNTPHSALKAQIYLKKKHRKANMALPLSQ